MNTLLTTNVLLMVIVLCIVVLTILVAILLIHLIGTTRKLKNIVTVFDHDVMKARSALVALKDTLVGYLVTQKK